MSIMFNIVSQMNVTAVTRKIKKKTLSQTHSIVIEINH